jgi:dipeptidyl-peptidase-4
MRTSGWRTMAVVGMAAAMAAAQRQLPKPNYRLASEWTAAKVSKLVFDTTITPHWYASGDKFWYAFKTSIGTSYYVVDPVKKTRAALFDHSKVAEQLTELIGLPYDGGHLPIQNAKLVNGDTALRFSVNVPRTAVVPGLGPETAAEHTTLDEERIAAQRESGPGRGPKIAAPPRGQRPVYCELNLASGRLRLLADYAPQRPQPRWAQISPNGKTIVFARGDNLYMMDGASYRLALVNPNDAKIRETRLTTDGVPFDSYALTRYAMHEDLGVKPRVYKDVPQDHNAQPRVAAVRLVWSRDSSEFAFIRADTRKVAELWVIHSLHRPRPTLETYKYAMPGEVNVPLYSAWAINVATHKAVPLNAARFPDQHLQIETEPVTNAERAAAAKGATPAAIWLGGADHKLYLTRISRDLHKIDFCTADPTTGVVTPIIKERSNVYIDNKPLRLVAHGTGLLVWSDRNGWGHYYLYGTDGTLKHQVDRGQFVAGSIAGVDDATNTMYFNALGYKSGEDVYYSHLYRIGLDGQGMKAIDPAIANHAIVASDDGHYFVDTYSRVDTAPEIDLDNTAGQELRLERTDVKALEAAGYKFPMPFSVKADDGITDLYGVMFRPFDFNPKLKYPLIEYVYPGPQTESVEATFNPKSPQMLLAQFGFIVIEVGNRGGSPLRDSWYHTYGYHNLRDYGLADKKRAAEELAQRYGYIDINRVGITGHSGGGFMSTAAILEYPDFFKVAVSESGNHDNNVYNNTWSEKHDGIREVDEKNGEAKFIFSIDKNSSLAKNLKGHLLLSTGDMDNNVSMVNTMRLANALIRANKRFDIIMLPGERHGYASDTNWFFWRKADYFCRYLLGWAPTGADMVELQRDVAETDKVKKH